MGRMSVAEAAKVLGVGPRRVQERILNGSLLAERVGHQWTIDEADLAAVKHHARPGRPLSEKSAWALIAVAAQDEQALALVSPPERSRARSRLRVLAEGASAVGLDEAAALVKNALGNRARRAAFAASHRDLPDVRDDARVRLSGLSGRGSNLAADDIAEGYVYADDLDDLVGDYLLSPANHQRANVVVHVLSSPAAELASDRILRSPLVRAADLAEHLGVRERNEAVNALSEVESSTFTRRGERSK